MPNKIEKPRMVECRHNSIPCYFDGEDEGCSVCIRNRAISEMDTYLEAIADVEGLEETIKQSLSDISGFSRDKFNNKFDGIYTELAQKISNRIKGEV